MRAPIARARPHSTREDDGTAQLSIRDLLQVTPPPIRKRGRAGAVAPVVTPFEQEEGERFGPYVLREQLGEGGMAQVHRAERIDPRGTRSTVALKRMWTHLSEDPDFVDSFVHEAQLACRLEHPNIARAYELGKAKGTYYIAMELVAGPTLGQILTQSRTAAGAIPLPIIVEILIQLCDALDYAHGEQIIHRDVSPANVIVSNGGVVKLIDFGIAKAKTSRQTQAGIIKGKLAYVAPEYTYGQLDARADLFSVGVVAYELITGQRLMLGENPFETITNIRQKPIQPPSRYNAQVSRDLDDVVLTAVQRDPSKRWQNAAAMRTALHGIACELPPCDGSQIRAWIEWAFAKQPRTEHSICRVLDALDPGGAADHDAWSPATVRSPKVTLGRRDSGASPTIPGSRSAAVAALAHAPTEQVPRARAAAVATQPTEAERNRAAATALASARSKRAQAAVTEGVRTTNRSRPFDEEAPTHAIDRVTPPARTPRGTGPRAAELLPPARTTAERSAIPQAMRVETTAPTRGPSRQLRSERGPTRRVSPWLLVLLACVLAGVAAAVLLGVDVRALLARL